MPKDLFDLSNMPPEDHRRKADFLEDEGFDQWAGLHRLAADLKEQIQKLTPKPHPEIRRVIKESPDATNG